MTQEAGKDSLSRNEEIVPDSVVVDTGSDSLFKFLPVSVKPVKPVNLINPSKVMYHSLAIPGWGQLDNGSKKKAWLFITAEAICIGGYFYYRYEIENGNYSEFEKENLRTDRNTFILYWVFAKIFGMVDAYVDAQLKNYDVRDITPEELKNK